MSQTDVSSLSGTNLNELFHVARRDGFFAGPTLFISLPISGLGVDVSALYDMRKVEIDGKNINQQQVAVPANMRFDLDLLPGLFGAYFAAGPQVSFNIGHEGFSWTDREAVRHTFRLQSSTFAVNLGAGLKISKFDIGAVYQLPIGRTADLISIADTIDQAYEVSRSTSRTWQLMLAYRF